MRLLAGNTMQKMPAKSRGYFNIMKYLFNERIEDKTSTSGFRLQEIEIPAERWAWGVVYKDDSELKQFGDDGRFHQFGEINQKEVRIFTLYRMDNMNKRYDIVVRDGMQIFHFYRNFIFNVRTPEERRERAYVFGYKENNHTSYFYILPDDRMVIGNGDIDLNNFNI